MTPYSAIAILLLLLVGCGKAHTDAACETASGTNLSDLIKVAPKGTTIRCALTTSGKAIDCSIIGLDNAIDLKPTSDHFDKGWHDKAAVPEAPKDSK
jgi:hypothetical protein